MKKVVVASLLAFTVAVGIASGTPAAFAQTQVNLGSNAQSKRRRADVAGGIYGL